MPDRLTVCQSADILSGARSRAFRRNETLSHRTSNLTVRVSDATGFTLLEASTVRGQFDPARPEDPNALSELCVETPSGEHHTFYSGQFVYVMNGAGRTIATGSLPNTGLPSSA